MVIHNRYKKHTDNNWFFHEIKKLTKLQTDYPRELREDPHKYIDMEVKILLLTIQK